MRSGGRDLAATFISLEACPYSGPMPVGWPEVWTVPGTRLPSTSCFEGLVCHICNGARAWQVHLPAPRSQKAKGQGICVAAGRWTPVLDLGEGPRGAGSGSPENSTHSFPRRSQAPPTSAQEGASTEGASPELKPSLSSFLSVSLLLLVFISDDLYVSLTSLPLFLTSSLYSPISPFCCLALAPPPPQCP